MDEWGLTLENFAEDIHLTRFNGYVHFPALTLLVYETLRIIPREAEHMYHGRWTVTRIVYFTLRLWAFLAIIIITYISQHNFIRRPVCIVGQKWFATLPIQVLLPGTLKTLLTLRLRALWNQSLTVTLVLCFVTIAEILTGLVYVIASSTDSVVGGVPLHGCYSDAVPSEQDRKLKMLVALTVTRLCSTSVEVILMLIKLVQMLRASASIGQPLYKTFLHIKRFTPITYVFYRDGTLFLIPLLTFVLLQSVSELIGTTTIGSVTFGKIDWTIWLAAVYYLLGMRLILNLREANCKMTESVASQQLHSMLQFRHGTTQDELGIVAIDQQQ